MSKRAKAILTIALGNNDRIRLSLVQPGGANESREATSWADVQNMLLRVMPEAERKKGAAKRAANPAGVSCMAGSLAFDEHAAVCASTGPSAACFCHDAKSVSTP